MEPGQLFSWLAEQPLNRDACLECGAGTGEVAQFLSQQFTTALAMDRQPRNYNINSVNSRWIVGNAENLPFEDESLDLILSVQALHHFDFRRHVHESKRVLKRGGCFAALSWGKIIIPNVLTNAYANVIDAIATYWEAERSWVLSGYKGLQFPGDPIEIPETIRTQYMTSDEFMLHVSTWSALQLAIQDGIDIPEPNFNGDEDESNKHCVSWPLHGQVFRI